MMKRIEIPKPDRERLLRWLRRGLIVLLTASAVFLTLQTLKPDSQMPSSIPEALPREDQNLRTARDSAGLLTPRAVMVFRSDGSGEASVWDGEETARAFGQFAALLGETLGSAGERETMTPREYQACLEREGVFLDLGAAYPLTLLTGWLGGGSPASDPGSAEQLCLLPGGETVELCFRSETGDCFRCASAAQSETLLARMAEFQGAPAAFAFAEETERGVRVQVIPETLPERPSAGFAPVRLPGAETVMEALGMNSYVAAYYQESDGTGVYIEDEQTLRMGPDGTLRYRAGSGGARAETEAEAIELALALSRAVLGPVCGDAELQYTGLERDEENRTLWVDYAIRGVPVHLSAGHAAELEIRGGMLRRATLLCRSFALQEEPETIAPMRFAAAIAGAQQAGVPVLIYRESAEGLRCQWVNDGWM